MNGIRCALVDANGLVVNYFMASPENDAVNSQKRDRNGLACVPHAQALPGDTLLSGIWVQSPINIPIPDPVDGGLT